MSGAVGKATWKRTVNTITNDYCAIILYSFSSCPITRQVAICDNLELPFRDESFDAVLSLAVVHHFATTERRVSAIRELARILRIGGRVVITVWALEQKSRRFESQDVLIPWQSPKSKNTATSDDEEDDDDFLPPYHAYTYNEDSTHSNSSRSQGDGDSSSLSSSSPSDTCYSFVRRALQVRIT